MFELTISTTIMRDGLPYYEEKQISHRLDKEQLVDMEKDLMELKLKWAKISGVKV